MSQKVDEADITHSKQFPRSGSSLNLDRQTFDLLVGGERWPGRGQVALPEKPDLAVAERADNGMDESLVVEEDEVAFFPVVGVHVLRRDGRPLELVDNVADAGQVVDHRSILEVDFAHHGRMDLQCVLVREGILPDHRENLDVLGIALREVRVRDFLAF